MLFYNDEVSSAYNTYRHSQWIRFSGMSALVAGILIPVFGVLDYLLYPDRFWLFIGLRIACIILIALLVLLSAHTGNRHVKLLTMAGAFLIQVMINYMVVITGGADSGYYAGLNLTVIAMGLILPAVLYETIFFVTATVALYASACAVSGSIRDGNTLIENLFFLIGTGIIAAFSTHFLERRRYLEFLLSYQLEQRNKELDALNRRRTEFFANVSHELRTPLTLILAPIQELLSGSILLSDKVASRLSIVRDNGLRLLKLVNDLLDIIRFEEGKGKLDSTPLNISSVVRGTAEGMIYLADTKEIELTWSVAREDIIVNGDVRALEKILANLVNNSIKFTPKGGAVRVEADVAGCDAVIRVNDSGIGISIDEQEHIFDRFHQVDGSSTRQYRGTGLGLALVKELTEQMEGRVEVQSEIEKGTCISVRFPLSSDATDLLSVSTLDNEDGIEQMHRQAEQRGGLVIEDPDTWDKPDSLVTNRPTLLIVEDEPDMRRYLVDLLEVDYNVLQARTGNLGLSIALEKEPELVLLDVMLPEMDGLEVCRRLRSARTNTGLKIMLLTARVDDELKITALKYGADDFLTKPFSSVEVRTRLRNLVFAASLERNLAERNRSLETALKALKETQAQLIQSEKLNALGNLSAGLLHEINNPLNYSITALQLIRADPAIESNDLVQEMLGDIDEGVQRVRAIVSDLRAFAYPSEAEKSSPFDVRDSLESALRFTSHELDGIALETELPENALVLGSKSHITQVFVNVISNSAKAIKASNAKHHGEIRIQGEVRDAFFWITVADNGVGMDQETLERIFDPFFTTRDVGEGMGLGLSICHTIIANHGGQLLARSNPGEGTELEFSLPLSGQSEIGA
jgi:signal transduction histidine kinase